MICASGARPCGGREGEEDSCSCLPPSLTPLLSAGWAARDGVAQSPCDRDPAWGSQCSPLTLMRSPRAVRRGRWGSCSRQERWRSLKRLTRQTWRSRRCAVVGVRQK
eukprot:scaffold132349_cov33-Tisochrysis_lutea.AAC.3